MFRRSETKLLNPGVQGWFASLRNLKPYRRSHEKIFPQMKGLRKRERRLQPTNILTYMFGSFLGTFGTWHMLNAKLPTEMPDEELTEEQAEMRVQNKDPNRIPWPLLHQRVTQIREGKQTMDELERCWEQTKFYYRGDWLIPVEMTQVLKYSTGKFLSQYCADPEQMRKEILVQLLNVKYGRATAADKVTDITREIITVACDDLAKLSFKDLDAVPLVPTHTI
jgi:hypothetical protein